MLPLLASTLLHAPAADTPLAPISEPRAQVSLTAVMVTQFPMRLSVYADQFEDVAAHRTSGAAAGGER